MVRSKHFSMMLQERGIESDWVDLARERPDRVENHDDGTCHYLKKIPDRGDRWLRVVVNVLVDPERAVTAFFDRRLKRKSYENKS